MSSGTEIILDALAEIGAHSIASPAQPGAITKGRDKLNSMLQSWLNKGIDLGTIPLDAPGDELSEPSGARNGIVSNLAIRLSTNFDNGKVVVSQILKSNADRDYYDIKDSYQINEIPEKIVSSTLPRGAGNTRGDRTPIFSGEGFEISN